jgi:hypothetical protein
MLVGAAASAQSTEIWPELDVYWQPAAHQRTFLELSSSTEREGTKREATIGLYQDYLSLPKGYLRAGYRFTFSTRDASYRESRIVGEGVVTTYSSDLVRLLNRTRVELRWVNGAYSYRVRDRLHFQRLAAKGSRFALAPYGTFEVYYDSREASISRVAGRIGSEARLGGPGIDRRIYRAPEQPAFDASLRECARDYDETELLIRRPRRTACRSDSGDSTGLKLETRNCGNRDSRR